MSVPNKGRRLTRAMYSATTACWIARIGRKAAAE